MSPSSPQLSQEPPSPSASKFDEPVTVQTAAEEEEESDFVPAPSANLHKRKRRDSSPPYGSRARFLQHERDHEKALARGMGDLEIRDRPKNIPKGRLKARKNGESENGISADVTNDGLMHDPTDGQMSGSSQSDTTTTTPGRSMHSHLQSISEDHGSPNKRAKGSPPPQMSPSDSPSSNSDDDVETGHFYYKPTPAQLWARDNARKRQIREYRNRIAGEERVERARRRMKEEADAAAAEKESKRKVRWADVGGD